MNYYSSMNVRKYVPTMHISESVNEYSPLFIEKFTYLKILSISEVNNYYSMTVFKTSQAGAVT